MKSIVPSILNSLCRSAVAFGKRVVPNYDWVVLNYIMPWDLIEFKEIRSKPGNKVFFFTATSCLHCERISPTFEILSAMNPDMSFIHVDVEALESVANISGINFLPTFQFYQGTVKVAEVIGADENSLKQHILSLK